jgi:polyhydroxyalkanoate synthesis regulator phasin
MGTDDGLKRYLDMGVALTQTLGATAEGLVKELIKTGESQRGQVDDLVGRGRRGTEDLLDLLRREVSSQLNQLVSELGLATKADLADLEARLRRAERDAVAASAVEATSEVASPRRPRRPRATTGSTGSAPTAKRAGRKAAPADEAASTTEAAGSRGPAKRATKRTPPSRA